MRIVFWGKGRRASLALKGIIGEKWPVALVVGQPGAADPFPDDARELGCNVVLPEDPNSEEFASTLRSYSPELFILGGYGLILQRRILEIPTSRCVNLHGGKLPQYRGSSPLNWVLINGESSFTISIIEVDERIDTGDVLDERTFPIGPNDTIADLHTIANAEFPVMLNKVVRELADDRCRPRRQQAARAGYYPRRFPDDGIIFFDQLTAQEVHNRIRALTDPYPGAVSFYGNRRVKLLSSHLPKIPFYGEAGRIYRTKATQILVGAKDQCLWLDRAEFEDDGSLLAGTASKYEKLATVRDLALGAIVVGHFP